jgi:hypothetical protein
MDCETCHLNVTLPTDGFGDHVTVCPECGRYVCPGPTLAPRSDVEKPSIDPVTPLAVLDPVAHDQLEMLLRDGVVREYQLPWGPTRTLTSDDRCALLEQLPDLVPITRCDCGDAVCQTYDFLPRADVAWRSVIQFDVPGIAVLELDEQGRILGFECITNTKVMTSPLIYPAT